MVSFFWRCAIKRESKGNDKRARINGEIVATQVRLIASDGSQVGLVTLEDALKLAAAESMDLVEIAADAEPIVCRVMDYGKHLFALKQKKKEAKKKQRQTQVKEMKFRPGTEEGDYQVKLRNLKRFLEAGDKAKVTLRFRGREMAHQNLGLKLLERVKEDLLEFGTVEQEPNIDGRMMIMVIGPQKKK